MMLLEYWTTIVNDRLNYITIITFYEYICAYVMTSFVRYAVYKAYKIIVQKTIDDNIPTHLPTSSLSLFLWVAIVRGQSCPHHQLLWVAIVRGQSCPHHPIGVVAGSVEGHVAWKYFNPSNHIHDRFVNAYCNSILNWTRKHFLELLRTDKNFNIILIYYQKCTCCAGMLFRSSSSMGRRSVVKFENIHKYNEQAIPFLLAKPTFVFLNLYYFTDAWNNVLVIWFKTNASSGDATVNVFQVIKDHQENADRLPPIEEVNTILSYGIRGVLSTYSQVMGNQRALLR
ncbi:hypothetical protein CTI12_AA255450 [Artemisia annua]|uniref:Uncharacterized protein n=1 Tax=Artemisia annua TaxID=35608 RepID=A0A2U1NL17_ARTAN|nr:hypothetical protein CTI12_AA255450 [Artemisia annua]